MSQASENNLALIESELKGKTLLIYWYFLKSHDSTVGVREIQRSLGFSSPSVAAHHLEKLLSLGLVEKTKTGEYFLVQQVKVGVLRFFTKMGRFLVPRYLFYSVLLTTMLLFYIFYYGHTLDAYDLAALIFGISSSLILWYETFRLWRERPF
jgi:predicted DNA-binding transcriptional regulator